MLRYLHGPGEATVQALAEQEPGKQIPDLLEQLPKELKQTTAAPESAAQRSLADFSAVRELA